MKTSQIEKWLSTDEEFDEELIKRNGSIELCAVIIDHMDRANITRAELIRQLDIDRIYGYQLLNGTRPPTRNHLIKMGLLFGLDMESFQRLLKIGRKKPLYVRDMFDAKVFYAVKHKMEFKKALEFIWNE